jgi:hypothetical protein
MELREGGKGKKECESINDIINITSVKVEDIRICIESY